MNLWQGIESGTGQRLITVKQAISLLGIGRTLFYELLEVGSLKAVKIGRRRLIALSEIESFIGRLRGIQK